MARTTIPQSKKAKAIGISLPPSLIRQGKALAFSKGVSFSRLVRNLLAEEVIKAGK
jgi:hypothetical protein